MAAADEQEDEFDSLYPDADFDAESLAQVELLATQQQRQAINTKSQSAPARETETSKTIHNGSLYPLISPRSQRIASASPKQKRQKLELSQGPPRAQGGKHLNEAWNDQDDDEPPEVMWTDEGGYVQITDAKGNTSTAAKEQPQPGPNDFAITHQGPGRPPGLDAGRGQLLQEQRWEDQQSRDKAQDEAGVHKQNGVPQGQPIHGRKSPSLLPSDRDGSINGHAHLQDESRSHPKSRLGAGHPAPPSASALYEQQLLELREENAKWQAKLEDTVAESRARMLQAYSRDGEIKMVRQKNEKVEKELAEMRAAMQRQQLEFEQKFEEQAKLHAAEKERSDTSAAFHRLEHETSARRPVWPGSVRKRPREDANQSYAASQTPHAPVVPLTPTKRQRNVESHSPSVRGSPHSRAIQSARTPLDDYDLSPSKSKLRGQPSMIARESRTRPEQNSTSKQFAGFDNSFAQDAVPAQQPSARRAQPESQPAALEPPVAQSASPANHHVDAEPFDAQELHRAPGKPVTVEDEWQLSISQSRRKRYLWALSSFSQRRARVSALLLAHTSEALPAPLSLPASRYLTAPVAKPSLRPDHSGTLHRLLDTKLPSATVPHLHERHRVATELLLSAVTRGAGVNDGERRFAFLLKEENHQRPENLEALARIEEQDYWDCEEAAAEGMDDLYEDLSSALRSLMAIYLRICMVDALQDVLELATAVIVAQPLFINQLLSSSSPHILTKCAPIDGEANSTSKHSQPAGDFDLTRPARLTTALAECARKACKPLPLHISSPASVPAEQSEDADTSDPAAAAGGGVAATQSRKARQKRIEASEKNAAALRVPWDMGQEAACALLSTIVDLLNCITWELNNDSATYLRDLLEQPAFISIFLDGSRQADTMLRFLHVLTRLCQQGDLWKTIVACRFNTDVQPNLPALITKSRTPLLELLSKHLVDLRSKQEPRDAHQLHCAMITLLTQLVVRHDDALRMARESRSLMAALVQSIHTDTSYVWNDDGRGQTGRDTPTLHLCQRIVLDVRLLAHIYAPASSSASSCSHLPAPDSLLLDRLSSHESHLLLNGIRHCFILAFSRLAFADEPTWMDEDSVKELQSVADICSDLLDAVLSPEEVEGAWEICQGGGTSEEEQEEEMARDHQYEMQREGSDVPA